MDAVYIPQILTRTLDAGYIPQIGRVRVRVRVSRESEVEGILFASGILEHRDTFRDTFSDWLLAATQRGAPGL